MNKLQDSYFGNYRGIVKQHGLNGLCKIYFPGVYPKEYETNITKLPWAEPASSLFGGGSLLNGSFMYPDIESTVWGFFEAGNINMPVFFAQTNNDKTQFISGECSIVYGDFLLKLDTTNNVLNISNSKQSGKISLNADTIEMLSKILKIQTTSLVDITSPNTTVKGTTKLDNMTFTGTTITGVSTINGFVPHSPG